MEFALKEEQILIQQTAHDFAKEYIEPIADEIDRNATYPREIVCKLAENDFLGLYLPTEFGGADAGYLSYVLAVEELAKVSAGVASILVNHASLAAYVLNRWGTDNQKQDYLTLMCKGEKLAAVALSEPGAAPGSGPNRVVAVRTGNEFVLNGRKCHVANGGAAGIYVVFAVTDATKGSKSMSAFLVDASTIGLSSVRNIRKMGMRACPSTELIFNNVKIPANNILGTEGEGIAIVQVIKAVASVAEGAVVVGIAQAAMEDVIQYAKQRVQFGRPIAKFPAVQNMLAEMSTNIHLARLAIYDAANSMEQGKEVVTEAAMIKLFVSRIGQNALIDAVQIEGGYGFSDDMKVSRYFRDIKGSFTIDSSADFPEQIIAAALLA